MQQPYEQVWGPIPLDEALSVGATYGATSRLIKLSATQELLPLVLAARNVIPDDILPRDDDTPETLAARLSQSDFLDDIHFPVGGHGRNCRVQRLNATQWAQPRRVTWSVPAEADDEEAATRWFFGYTQARREPSDWRCRLMPLAVFNLVVYLWKMARPVLGRISAAAPPTAVQLMVYYTAFRGAITRHRDNFNSADYYSRCAAPVWTR